jgi:hypothetical protein
VRQKVRAAVAAEKGDDVDEDRMLKWFAYEHLPEKLQVVSRPFGELAMLITSLVSAGPERTVALRKLLEAKDAAVRAVVHPGA